VLTWWPEISGGMVLIAAPTTAAGQRLRIASVPLRSKSRLFRQDDQVSGVVLMSVACRAPRANEGFTKDLC
jgi:hypothetical protein